MSRRSKVYRARRVAFWIAVVMGFVAFIVANPNSYDYVRAVFDEEISSLELKEEQTIAESAKSVDVLASLAIKDKDYSEKYYRKAFYDSWSTTSSGCNMREAILDRDLIDKTYNGCKIMSGVLEDPYTGKTMSFTRGQDTSSEVQIDHVVALSNAWATGAYQMTSEERYEISQDPLNLLAVNGSANQQKSDGDASEWLPSNENFQCEYVARQISVKYKYHLWVTPSEKSAMLDVLATCPDQESEI